ncbi:MAG: adenylyltransferase/cytidyltransferase family protein [Candidatus Taylorbacteria bacterium]|nr:adenylyltransferase/cytidyltransferase family protein [Candidatus Taylorbacteria bacterium]
MICKSYTSLPSIRRKHKDKKLVFCSGSFDLVHAGHILFFEDCKRLGDVLTVGVASDMMLRRHKGKGRPVLNQHVRLKTIDALKPVDYCFLDESTHRDHLLGVIEEVFKRLRPDIYVINQDTFDVEYRKMLAKKYGVKMKILKRTAPPEFENISTSKIIDKIKKSS